MKKVYSYIFLFFYLFYVVAIGHHLYCWVHASQYQKIVDDSNLGWAYVFIYLSQADVLVLGLFLSHYFVLSNTINYVSVFLVVLSYILHLVIIKGVENPSSLLITKDISLILVTIVMIIFTYVKSNRHITGD